MSHCGQRKEDKESFLPQNPLLKTGISPHPPEHRTSEDKGGSTGSVSSADVPKGCSTDFSEREGGHSHGGDQDRDMGHGSHGCHLLLLLASVSVKPGHGAVSIGSSKVIGAKLYIIVIDI